MSKHKYSLSERLFSFLLSVLSICAVVLIAAILIQQYLLPKQQDAPVAPVVIVQTPVTPEPMTIRITPEPTAPPSPTPVTTSTPEPVPEATYDFLPVYSRIDTDAKIIAITVDDCSHLEHLKTIAAAADKYNARLTLFPYGQSVMKEGMAYALRACVNELGFQIENRTWSDALLYRLSDEDMALEIWQADMAVDYSLGAEYSMHLFRMRNNSASIDTRTQHYLKQLGYDGIVSWTVSSNGKTIDELCLSLAPGYIYQFTSSKEDTEKLVAFMKYADKAGYRMLTVNQLLGVGPNDSTPVSSAAQLLAKTFPPMEGYEPVYITLKSGSRSWQVNLVQRRLVELGYLPRGTADGVFGDSTSSAISRFQVAAGLMGTGMCDADTQTRLFSDYAPVNPGPSPSPLPMFPED